MADRSIPQPPEQEGRATIAIALALTGWLLLELVEGALRLIRWGVGRPR